MSGEVRPTSSDGRGGVSPDLSGGPVRGFFRDREVRRDGALYAALTVLAALTGAFFSWKYALVGAFSVLAGGLLHMTLLCLRTRRIRLLTEQLDKALHGCETLTFSDCREGELAILQSELEKLMVRLREQRDLLSAERTRLADSMADISHQLRTPLTSMNLTLTLLQDPGLSLERRDALLRDLRRGAARVDRLCVQLLKLAQLDAGTARFRRESVELSALVRQACEPLAVLMELKSQSFSVIGEGWAEADSGWTAEAVSNLVKNCAEHTPEGGKIAVCIRQNPIYAEITVEDDGPGFLQEDLPRLFERFYRGAGSSPDGFGIGLALARSVFAAQNGTLKAENRPEGGARFVARLYAKGTV